MNRGQPVGGRPQPTPTPATPQRGVHPMALLRAVRDQADRHDAPEQPDDDLDTAEARAEQDRRHVETLLAVMVAPQLASRVSPEAAVRRAQAALAIIRAQ